MIYLFYIIFFLLGVAIGSFLNVVILRLHTGEKLTGRSHCFNCDRTLSASELIPLFSFIFQRGKCRKCGSRISWQYPVVEAGTGLLFALIAWPVMSGIDVMTADFMVWLNTFFSLLVFWAIFSVLMAILVYDLYHLIIPDELVYTFIGLSLLSPILSTEPFLSPTVFANLTGLVFPMLSGLAGALLLFGFFWSLWAFSGGRWMGFGDAKLVIGIGFLLYPVQESLLAVMLAFVIGAVVGVGLLAFNRLSRYASKDLTLKTELPFAPFLILGTLLVFVFGWSFIDLLSLNLYLLG